MKSYFKQTVIMVMITMLVALISETASPSHAAGPWYVAPGGNDANDCLSPATVCASINGALNKPGFIPGDTVYVATGTYTGTGSQVVLLNKNATLSGGWDSTFTAQNGMSTIDGQGTYQGMTVFNEVTAVVEWFTIQNSSAYYGGGLLNFGTLTLSHSTITNNSTILSNGGGIYNGGMLTLNHSIVSHNTVLDSSRSGGGIYNESSTILILNDSIVTNNTAFDGGGIYTGGTTTINNSTISHNLATGSGGGVWSSSGAVNLNNSTISHNRAYYGGGIDNYGGTLTLKSSTVSQNLAISGGGILQDGGKITLQNVILAGNMAVFYGPDCGFGPITSAGYNLIGNLTDCNFTASTGDITNVEARLGSLIGSPGYHPLLAGSLAVNTGNPIGCTDHLGTLLTTDQRGVARVGRCDIGAYEYTVPGAAARITAVSGTPQHAPPSFTFWNPLQVAVLDNIGSPVGNTAVTFSAPTSGPGGTFVQNNAITITAVTGENGVASAGDFTANALTGSYTVTATVAGVITPAHFLLGNLGWYITPGGNDANDCQSPATACAEITTALEHPSFIPGDVILVATGTYTGLEVGDQVVLLDKDVRLFGGWNATFTEQQGYATLDGQGTRGVIRVNWGVTAVVEYFVIQNGNAWGMGGGGSGGISNAGHLTLNHITATGNNSVRGGGIFNRGILFLNNSAVNSNVAGSDGGIANGNFGTGLPIFMTINNSTVSGNTANDGGGGISNGPTATLNLNNSTVSGNTAQGFPGSGGIYNQYHQGVDDIVTLQNSIVAGNTHFDSPDCFGAIGSLGYNLLGDVTYCNFNPTVGDLTNVDARLGPLTGLPGYHPLLVGSQAIDAGNPAGCADHLGNPLDADQRGVLRVRRCDIGAYEYDGPINKVFLPVISRPCPILYEDDFSNPASGWPVFDRGDILWEYRNGEYRILLRNANWWGGAKPGFSATDYTVAVDVRNATGVYGSYGLLFGAANDFSQFYTFDITPDGYYSIWRFDAGNWWPLAEGQSGSINPGPASNRLKVERDGFWIRAYVNEKLLITVFDGTFTGARQMGLFVLAYDQPGVDVRFDNFVAYPLDYPPSCDTPAALPVTHSASSNPNLVGEGLTNRINRPDK